ncbi:MAG: Ig-like domain-containing protein, partial [Oscillospiraceae bacterium]|nr:Ig-like domain-containing protein [Oscillospiraceae bacterium]
TAEDWAQVSDVLEGKIALCYRGSINFAEKAINAVNAGAIATFIVNNEPGVISMDLTDYYYTNPAASINQADGELIKAASTAVTDTAGNVLYYTGTMDVSTSLGAVQLNSDYYTMSSFSSWGVPGSLELKPEITAPGGNIYSLNGMSAAGGGHDQYIAMSGTSMAAPQMAGMAALVMQYIRANELDSKTGLDARTLAQSLLMSTAVPMLEAEGAYYPVLQQGAGLGNVGTAVTADSYILMQENATASWADGKVKVELGDDPQREGAYEFSFTLHNLTDVEKSFDLSADFFMQRPVDDGAGNCCMGTSTDLIPVDVVWQVDGLTLETDAALDGMDFNGDGVVNSDDGQTLLDHATGLGTTLSNQDKADLDADGDIDTHDAYLFLRQLSTGVALLPAGGAVEITATVTLSEEWGERVDTYYPNGTYVQGYVFAEGVSSAEGLEGTCHSIPVLGFYGNWTDPSMFEVGSYAEYAAGDVTKLPYLGNGNVNSFGIVFADDPENAYFFGGNPIIADETYLPERNAINSENGDTVHQLSFASIRNAVETRFTAVNKTTGETIVEKYNGPAAAAYYDANWEMWYNSQRVMNTDFMPTGAAEGDIFELTMTLAPEYYMDAEGNVNWDAMGPGASYVVPIVVDNTAPTLTEVSTNYLGNTLTVTASDNQYVAGVVLYNIAGTKRLSVAGAKMDIQPGEEAEYVLDLTGVNGKKFLVQVHDYAMNTVTYILEAEIGEPEPLPDFIAYDLTYEWWASFTKTATYDQVLEYATTDLTFYAATIVDHMILAATDDGTLYVMPEDEMSSMTRVGKLGTIVTDMAYNPADGKVYGVNEHGRLISIDKLTAAVEELGQIGVITNTLACDEDGTFYCNGLGTGTVYSFTLDTIGTPAVLVADLGISSQYIQSMEISPNDGQLYYASYYQIDYGYFAYGYSYFFEIDPETGDAVVYNDLYDQLAAMIIPAKEDQGGDWTKPTDKVSGIQLSETAVSLLRSNQTTLTATVMPWTATDRTVRWSSADESIATVNEDGLVTAVALGTTTITATSNLDPSISASCTVTVETLDLTLEGTLKDADGKNQFFSWNMATDTTWTGGTAIDTSMASATVNAANRKVYIMDAASNDWRVHVVDPATGVSQQTYTNSLGYPLWDMEYSSFFSTAEAPKVHGIYYTYFLPAKDPADLDNVVFDLWAFFAYYSGASGLVGVTSLGKEQRVLNGTLMDTEHVIMLDNAGFIWDFWLYPSEDTVGASAAYSASDLSIVYPGDSTGEHMYSSLVAGDDGYLYLSAFTGKTNELYRLSYNAATGIYESLRIADMGENVWPAILTDVRSNTAGTNTLASPEATLELEAVQLSEAELAAAAKHATVAAVAPASEEARAAKMQAEVRPGSDAEIAGETVTLNITTEAAATNGLSVVTYDADKLTLESAVIYGDYTARLDETGKLTFGYVALTEIPAGGTIATLTFRAAEAENSVVSVEHRQVNNAAGTAEALLVEFEHANTEIRTAKDATCTEDGYTGDVYCTDCGALITEGEVIPATGHSYGDWTVTKAATCFAEGEEIRVCACGETETRVTEKRTECPSDTFSDLDKTQWYHEGV